MTSSLHATRTRNDEPWVLWVVAVSCALHATEELSTGWQSSARDALGIAMPTSLFVVMNAILVVVAVMTARVGWRRPTIALIIPCATLVNALAFHMAPTLLRSRRNRGRRRDRSRCQSYLGISKNSLASSG